MSDAACFTLNPNGSWGTEPSSPDWVNSVNQFFWKSAHPSRASEPWKSFFWPCLERCSRIQPHLPCSACPSASPGPSSWNACRLRSSGTSPALACSAPCPAPPRPSTAAQRGEEGRWEERRGGSQWRNKQAGRYDGWLVGKRIVSTWSSFLVEDELKQR